MSFSFEMIENLHNVLNYRDAPIQYMIDKNKRQLYACTWTWHNRVTCWTQKNSVEDAGIDPATSRMLSERSTIWANPPVFNQVVQGCRIYEYVRFTLYWILEINELFHNINGESVWNISTIEKWLWKMCTIQRRITKLLKCTVCVCVFQN